MYDFGELKDVGLRDVWKKEAQDFTPWLANNISLLSEAIGIDIAVKNTEEPSGRYRMDIFAHEVSDETRKIIIENQLESTDHVHLGELITYASHKDAKVLIWVAKSADKEHVAAVNWLNRHTDSDVEFYLCVVKLYCIGDSKPAPKFEIAARPSEVDKEEKRFLSAGPTERLHSEYWEAFREYAESCDRFKSNFRYGRTSFRHYKEFSIGSPDCYIGVTRHLSQGEIGVELYIPNSGDLYNQLYSNRDAIESKFGTNVLEWQELPNRKASRIITKKPVAFDDRSQWEAQFKWVTETMIQLKETFLPYVQHD